MMLESYLQELVQLNTTPKHAQLVNLSGLTNEELDAFVRWWPSVPVERRRLITEWLVSVAEDNVDLDFNAIFKRSLEDPDAQVREKAVTGLWECDDRSVVGPLMKLLKSDPSEQVRAAAAMALGKFSVMSETGKLLPRDGERIKELLLAVVDNPTESIDVRRRSLESAACYNTPRIKDLIKWAYNSSDPKLRLSSLYAMGRTCDPAWLATLVNESKSADIAMRFEAANAFAEIGEEEAIPYIIPLLQDEDSQVQLAAVHALGAIGGPLAERALRRCLKHPDEALQDAAKDSLEQMEAEGDPLAFKFLHRPT
ncbi:MAG: HEAT repeat domain-containing protein [Chloroflexi bacterium]|nr:HEAT repeat domain-containing protein [Chloroflexota bacterium]